VGASASTKEEEKTSEAQRITKKNNQTRQVEAPQLGIN
jgi:hypothetical protein